MSCQDDTITAIATAPGEAGVSIVRISGPDSLRVADKVFSGPPPRPSERSSHVVLHGRITGDGGDVDEVLLLIMRAPHSYTCEDVVEIQGHGGTLAARRILRRVLESGARMAEPGEFTRRAFLNGRIDLLQAEAVLDLVRARSDRAAAAAVEQLEGGLSRRFNVIYDGLLSVATDLEATLDFPDDELPSSTVTELAARLTSARDEVGSLLGTWDEGHLIREGALVVIAGRPNVGKSTLMNALLGKDRVIVSHLPGTTRDTIEEGLVLDGIPIRLVDTAGLREAQSEIEQEGIRRTKAHMQKADLHLYVVDASAPLEAEDRDRLKTLGDERTVVVLNKTDLGRVVKAEDVPGFAAVETSLVKGVGVDEVRREMSLKLESGVDLSAPPHAVISERHRQLLTETGGEIGKALELLEKGPGDNTVLAAECLRSALESVGSATGRVYQEELLASIFSRFCIGK
ncbi:MAG: tRNA uridine-5-carboxymethylaminomethyl(34) synthesis GTPase MnmE [Verrucomicrobiota bacterium]